MPAPATKEYLRTTILTASPAELRLMLLDGAIRFATACRDALAERHYETAYTSVTRCQDILLELIHGLDPAVDRELHDQLSGLYTFLFTRLMTASSQRDPAIVDEVLQLLDYERQTWIMLLEQLARENESAHRLLSTPQPAHAPSQHGGSGLAGLVGATLSVTG